MTVAELREWFRLVGEGEQPELPDPATVEGLTGDHLDWMLVAQVVRHRLREARNVHAAAQSFGARDVNPADWTIQLGALLCERITQDWDAATESLRLLVPAMQLVLVPSVLYSDAQARAMIAAARRTGGKVSGASRAKYAKRRHAAIKTAFQEQRALHPEMNFTRISELVQVKNPDTKANYSPRAVRTIAHELGLYFQPPGKLPRL